MLWAATVVVFLLFFVGPGPTAVARTFAGRLATPARIWPRSSTTCTWTSRSTCSTCTGSGTCCRATSGTTTTRASRSTRWSARPCRPPSRWSSARRSCGSAYGVISGIISAVRPRSFLDRGFTTVGAVLLLDADVRARALADLDLRLQAEPGDEVLPVPRVRPAHHQPRPVVRVPDPAVAHAGPGDGRRLHPADPDLDARGPGRGLHPHRAVQGHARTARDRDARRCARRSPRW